MLPARYRSVRLLAAGGMGEVYLATDGLLERRVAVKVLSERYAEDTGIRQRFTREALAAARLSGRPHVVTVFDVGEHDGRPYIVMAYMAGGSVEERVRSEPPTPGRALDWLEQAAAALDEAHAAGVVHRDVKPGNLLLDGNDVLHVGDFGIARAAGLDSFTAPGTVLGTAGYLAPEQAAGLSAGPASDRFALGVVAFELLTGRRPFVSDTAATTATAALVHRPPPPLVATLSPGLPPALDPVFARALATSPDERPASCVELVRQLRAALWAAEAPTLVGAARVTAPTAPAHRRRRNVPALLAAALALALAGAAAAVALTLTDGGTKAANRRGPGSATAATRPRTVTETVTSTTAQPPPARAVDSRTPSQLNDAGYARLQAGDATGALPLLERAVAGLAGGGSLAEAYASYNLAWARFALGRCDGVAALLDRSQQVQGRRKEIDSLRKQVDRRCGAAAGAGRGAGRGTGHGGGRDEG